MKAEASKQKVQQQGMIITVITKSIVLVEVSVLVIVRVGKER